MWHDEETHIRMSRNDSGARLPARRFATLARPLVLFTAIAAGAAVTGCRAVDTRIAERQSPEDRIESQSSPPLEATAPDLQDDVPPPICPPAGEWSRLLRTEPEVLAPCATDSDPLARVFAAHAHARKGEGDAAARLYEEAAGVEAFSAIRPMLLVSAARARADAGHPESGLELLEQATNLPGLSRWMQAELAIIRGELAALANRHDLAREQAREATRLGHSSADVLKLREAKAAVALEDSEGARATIESLRLEHPGSALAAEIEELASRIGLPAAVDAFTPGQLSQRWSRWIRQGGASLVANECLPVAEALGSKQRPGPKADVAKARYECGRALSVLRRPESIPLFERAAAGDRQTAPDALLALARALSRGSDHQAVAAACQRLARIAPNSGASAECRYLSAYLTLQHGDRNAGLKLLRSVAERHSNHPRGRDAAWMEAMEAYRENRTAARQLFGNIAASAKTAELKAQALYWRGRTAESPEAAQRDWREAERLDPWGYYGWLAAVRLGETLTPTPLDDACLPAAPSDSPAEISPPDSAKTGALLLAAGFHRFASLELDEALPARRPEALLAAPFLAQARQYERLFRAGHAAGGERSPFPPPDDRRAAVEAAHPLAYPEALSAVSDVNRCLVLAVMKRESLFAPEATSSAQARGLLQLLPTTAGRVAEELGESAPAADALHDPSLNIRLGSRYLQRLIERFDHPLVAVAAYNAGPTAVAGWLERFPGLELDEWVERIPYRETRGYVKGVGGSFAAYSRLYGAGRPPVSLAPPGPRPAGIDY